MKLLKHANSQTACPRETDETGILRAAERNPSGPHMPSCTPHVCMCVCMCFYPCISTNLSTQQNPIHEETQKDIAHTHTHIHRGRPPVSPQMPGQLKQTGIKLAESLQKEPRNKPCSSYSQSHIKNSESQSPVHLRQANEPDAVQHL